MRWRTCQAISSHTTDFILSNINITASAVAYSAMEAMDGISPPTVHATRLEDDIPKRCGDEEEDSR
jgi:hypothetical protein